MSNFNQDLFEQLIHRTVSCIYEDGLGVEISLEHGEHHTATAMFEFDEDGSPIFVFVQNDLFDYDNDNPIQYVLPCELRFAHTVAKAAYPLVKDDIERLKKENQEFRKKKLN